MVTQNSCAALKVFLGVMPVDDTCELSYVIYTDLVVIVKEKYDKGRYLAPELQNL